MFPLVQVHERHKDVCMSSLRANMVCRVARLPGRQGEHLH